MCLETLKMLVRLFNSHTSDEEIKQKYKTKELCDIYTRLLSMEPSTTLKNNKTKLIDDIRKYVINMRDSYGIRLHNTSIMQILIVDSYEHASIFIEDIDERIEEELKNKEYALLETDELISIAQHLGCIDKDYEVNRAEVIGILERFVEC